MWLYIGLAFIIYELLVTFFPRQMQRIIFKLQLLKLKYNIKIIEITNLTECERVCRIIKGHCTYFNAVGFDCEWNPPTVSGRPPVALIQIATAEGLCCLFRLKQLNGIPSELQKILNNCDILKVGVAPKGDARFLENDYNVQVRNTLDLRCLAGTQYGLAFLSESYLGIRLDKETMTWATNWECETLAEKHKHYAAMDAFVGIEILKKLLLESQTSYYGFNVPYKELLETKMSEIGPFLDDCYGTIGKSKQKIPQVKVKSTEIIKYNHNTRKTPLYHNCYMHAPDGELLCSCDERKALWYLQRGLAEIIPGKPFSIKLKFEPQARATQDNGGRYYQQLKQNRCVVCGSTESYLKHNVVPREYRKHFHEVIKNHQSHDVVLTCLNCHMKATMHAKELKQKLAVMCSAPLSNAKYFHSKQRQSIKNYARALLNSEDKIPPERKAFLQAELKKFLGTFYLDYSLLQKAATLKTEVANTEFVSHGRQVVMYFSNRNNGLKELELMWRAHFKEKMQPQYLPALWSVRHNHSNDNDAFYYTYQ